MYGLSSANLAAASHERTRPTIENRSLDIDLCSSMHQTKQASFWYRIHRYTGMDERGTASPTTDNKHLCANETRHLSWPFPIFHEHSYRRRLVCRKYGDTNPGQRNGGRLESFERFVAQLCFHASWMPWGDCPPCTHRGTGQYAATNAATPSIE